MEPTNTKKTNQFLKWFFPRKTIEFQYPVSFLTHAAKVMPIFVSLAVVLPFAISIFFNILIAAVPFFSDKQGIFETIYAFLELALVIATFAIIYVWTKDKIIICGAIAFFLFTILPTIGSIILSFIFGLARVSEKTISSNTVTIILTAVFDLIAGVLVLVMSPYVRKSIVETFQKRWQHLLTFVVIMIIIGVFLSYAFSAFGSLINGGTTSNNQSTINVNRQSSVGLIILVAITTILIAPFIEECATRHSIYYLTGNKYLGFIVTFIYFAGMHVTSTFDWEHIFSYLGGSLILTSTFYLARANVTYSWLTHAGLNTVTFVILLAS